MGGTKKRTLASMEKSQNDEAEEETTKKKSEKKGPGERKRVDVLPPKMSDQEFMKSLAPLKAITLFNASKTLAVNAAVARTILASLESKGMISRVGGFSGHYVWAPAS
jgi:small subunit ribosomal protein S25e